MKNLIEPVTADELFDMSADGVRRELVRGELREMPPAGGEHGETTMKLSARVALFVDEKNLGHVFAAETGFLIERDPDTVRAPDCAYISRCRLPASAPRKYIPLAPDLVIETISPNDSMPSVEEKTAAWIHAGVQLVWIVNPLKRTLTIHRPGRPTRELQGYDILDGEDILPGFTLEVVRIWS